MRFRVERQGYSHGPWRVLWAETGDQVWQDQAFDHPNLGSMIIPGPVCFQTKREAVAWVHDHPQV